MNKYWYRMDPNPQPPLTLADLQKRFPRAGDNCACTGRIPIEFFTVYEREIRAVMREWKLRAIYRGARVSNARNSRYTSTKFVDYRPSMTMRCDADAVMLYRK